VAAASGLNDWLGRSTSGAEPEVINCSRSLPTNELGRISESARDDRLDDRCVELSKPPGEVPKGQDCVSAHMLIGVGGKLNATVLRPFSVFRMHTD
jgi:hypothetical protein